MNERGPLRVIGWGPFRMPGEKRRLAALQARYAEGELDHGQCLSNLAGLVCEALMRCDGLDQGTAYVLSVTVANTLNARPDVLRNLINSIDHL